jgi:hypothetical protein
VSQVGFEPTILVFKRANTFRAADRAASVKGLGVLYIINNTAHATRRKIAGSIPDEVIAFFNSRNPSSRTMATRSTQPLTEMSTRNLPGG